MNTMVTGGAANAVGALASLRQGLANVRQTLVVKGGDPYLRLLKHGEWVYGQEDAGVDDDSIWAVNPMSLQHGFIAWPPDGEGAGQGPLGEVMVPMTMPLPGRDALHDVGAAWSQQFSVQLRCVSGGDVGTQVLYKVGSVGGTNAVDKLITAIMQQLDDDPENPVPLIQLLVDSYPHKKWGRTFVPVLEVIGWTDMSGAMPVGLDEKRVAVAAPAPAPEPVKPKATRAKRTPAQQQAASVVPPALAAVPGVASAEDLTVGEPTVDQLELMLAERRAAAQGDPAEARKRELMAELAALGVKPPADVPAPAQPEPGTPIRRRRP